MQMQQNPTNNPNLGMSGGRGKSSTGLDENVAGALCYLGWWVTGLIFLMVEKQSKFVKFHAVQSLITFGCISALSFVFGRFFFLGLWFLSNLIWLLGIVLWILLMYQAYSGKRFKLPIVGNIAEKHAYK